VTRDQIFENPEHQRVEGLHHRQVRLTMETRKIQIAGGTTYTVSLPKDWASDHGLEAGARVRVHPYEDGSRCSSRRRATPNRSRNHCISRRLTSPSRPSGGRSAPHTGLVERRSR